jgi:hypothetical protein
MQVNPEVSTIQHRELREDISDFYSRMQEYILI